MERNYGSRHTGEGEVVDATSRRMRGMNGSQNGIPQYSTKERALKALRCSLEIKFAMQLDAVDKQSQRIRVVHRSPGERYLRCQTVNHQIRPVIRGALTP